LAERSFLALPRTPEAMVFDNFAGIPLRVQRDLLLLTADADPYADATSYFTRRANGDRHAIGIHEVVGVSVVGENRRGARWPMSERKG
jgi:hypothetical protein